MAQNPAEMTESEKTLTIGISSDNGSADIDRRISVAPMMDWTDDH